MTKKRNMSAEVRKLARTREHRLLEVDSKEAGFTFKSINKYEKI